jgi:signal transduction histidine kinase
MLASSPGKDSLPRQVSLPAVIDKVVADCQARIEMQNVELVLNFDRDLPCITADPLEIEQIFTNLIGNALYEMDDGGELAISLHSNSEKLWFSVTDSGGGIAEENIKHIFDPFFTTKNTGTGFGLSVVMRIVSSLGGKVDVSNVPGSGARFSVEIPLLSDRGN